MLDIGVIGYGYWGPNMVRNFMEAPETRVTIVADQDNARANLACRRYPTIAATTDAAALITSAKVAAVVIATPVSTHFDLAMAALRAGKHVLVEKPMAQTADQARKLIDEAARRGLTLMVDHTFIYTGAVQMMRDMVANGDVGEIYYYDSTRINLGLFQHDVNVIWDLAVHDLSILDFVVGGMPVSVSATGVSHVPGAPENTAFLSFCYDSGAIAHINVNWLSPLKIRRTLLSGSKTMIVYDDLEPSEKIKIYDKGISFAGDSQQIHQLNVSYRAGDMRAPKVDAAEALSVEANHFAACVAKGTKPMTDGAMGLRIVEMCEKATQSLNEQGRPVALDDPTA